MRICYFTRYPPAIGNESFSSYWLARDLGKAGHKVHVISNCWEMGNNYRVEIRNEEKRLLEQENVEVFSTIDAASLTYREQRLHGLTDRLVNIALKDADSYDADLIVASDCFPFGVAGFYTKLLTIRPMVLKINNVRVLQIPLIAKLVQEILRGTDKIEIREQNFGHFLSLGVPKGKITFIDDLVNPDYLSQASEAFDFSPYTDLDMKGKPLLTFIDRPEPYSKLFNLIRMLSLLKERDYILCIQLSNERTPLYEELQNLLAAKRMERQTIFIPPQPPWHFASLMKASSCIIYPGNAEEYRNHPQLIQIPFLSEALHCGKCVILSRSLHERSRFSHLCDSEHFLLFDTSSELRAHVESLIGDPEKAHTVGSRAQALILGDNDYSEGLKDKLIMFEDICKNFHNR